MKLPFIFPLFFIVLKACSQNYDPCGDIPSRKTINEIKHYFDLHPSTIGGSMANGIEKLTLGFDAKSNLTVDEARRLVVICAEIFLRNINSSKETKPFLIKYPFPINKITIDVFIHYTIPSRNFSVATLSRGKFKCVSYMEKEPKIVHEEPFEVALQIVRDEQQRMKDSESLRRTIQKGFEKVIPEKKTEIHNTTPGADKLPCGVFSQPV